MHEQCLDSATPTYHPLNPRCAHLDRGESHCSTHHPYPGTQKPPTFGQYEAEDTSNQHRAKFAAVSFSNGASKLAFMGEFIRPLSKFGVVKRCKEHHTYDWKLDIKTTDKAQELAVKFNKALGEDGLVKFGEITPLMVMTNNSDVFSRCLPPAFHIEE